MGQTLRNAGTGAELPHQRGGVTWLTDGSEVILRTEWFPEPPRHEMSLRITDTLGRVVESTFTIEGDDFLQIRTSASELSSDGHTFVARTFKNVYMWDVRSKEILHRLDMPELLPNQVDYLDFSADGKFVSLLSGLGDDLSVWDVESGRLMARLARTEGRIHAAEWAPDDSRLAVIIGRDLVVLDVPGGQPLYSVSTDATDVVWSRDGDFLASINYEVVAIQDAKSGQQLSEIPVDSDSFLCELPRVNWLPDDKRLAITYCRDVLLWDIRTGQLQGFSSHPSARDVSWLADGRTLVLSTNEGYRDDKYEFWDVETGNPMESPPDDIDITSLFPVQDPPNGFLEATANDGSVATISANREPTVVIRPADQSLVRSVSPGRPEIGAIAWSPDSQLLAVGASSGGCGDGPFGGGCYNKEGVVQFWNRSTGSLTWQKHYPDTGITGLAWSSDGSTLAIGLGAWDGVSGISGNEIILIDVQSGEQIAMFRGHSGNVTRLAFSPLGGRLASLSYDGTVIVWVIES